MADESTNPVPSPAEGPAPSPAEGPAPDEPAPAPEPAAAAAAPATADAGHGHGHGDDHGHDLPFNAFAIFLILVGLTAVSWGADKLQGSLSVTTISVLVMFVSCCKASLVVAYFMHFKYEGKWKYILTVPPLIMAVWLMVSLVPDIGNRRAKADPGRGIGGSNPLSPAPAEPGTTPGDAGAPAGH